MYDIIGIDMGTYSFKTSEDFVIRSIYNVTTSFNLGGSDILEYGGIRYQVGKGKMDTEIIKANRKDTMPLFLYSLAKSTSCDEVKLVCGLPKNQLDNDKYVETIKEKFIGTHEFKIGGKDRKITVSDITIFPEGMGAYYTITEDLSSKDIILIDIGGSTINVLLFKNNEFIYADVVEVGAMNLINEIRLRANTLHGRKFDIDDIARYVERGGSLGNTGDNMEYKYELAEQYVDTLFELLKLKFPYRDVEYILSGGGVSMFADNIIDRLGSGIKVSMIKDYLFANANGYANIGGVIYGED